MTPKEKAKELIRKFYSIGAIQCKECALIAVDEILNHHSQEQGLYRIDTFYWQEVKKRNRKIIDRVSQLV